MPLRRYCLVLLALVAAPFVSAAGNDLAAAQNLNADRSANMRTADLQTAFDRVQRLRHGINASEWFAQSGDYSAARTDRYTDAADIALMAQMGFDHARLSIDAAPLEQAFFNGHGGANSDFVARLDHAVDTMLANGLAVIIDLHPSDTYKQQLRTSNDAVDRTAMLWRRLAAHYAGRDPDRIFFEIMNEPEVYDSFRWAGIQQQLAEAIRAAAPRQTIIATGANYSNLQDLLALEPLADGNVIYNFHFYEPHEFTHQGASWGVPWWSYTHDIPYPPTEASMAEALTEIPDAVDRFALKNYWLDNWDGQRIRALIDEGAAWSREKNVPLISDEFGAFREHMDSASRARWIGDVRTALEANGIGWTMWDYRGGFGVVQKQDGQPAVVDEAVMKALGLKEK